MNIFIAGTIKSETPAKLAKHLKNCYSGHSLEETPNLPQGDFFIINYGRIGIRANINKKIYSDKIKAFELLRTAGLNVPKVYLLNNWQNISNYLFPLLARKRKHARGKDIIYLKTRFSIKKRLKRVMRRDVLVEYIPKEAEYRVHVLGNNAINISKKVPSSKTSIHHPHVWCKDRGWTLIDYTGNNDATLKELGIRAVRALNYDFGAVDIGLGKNGKYYIFEVNSAPRLLAERRRLYAKFFREKEKEYRRNISN